MTQGELKHVSLSEIYEPEESLRKVDRTTEKYLGLVESIRLQGVRNPINVRPLESEDGQPKYGLIDGLHRFSGSKDAGLDTIPCHITSLEDAELLEAQIIANAHKIETTPVEYSKAILKIIHSNPLMTRGELAGKLAKTESWLSQRLGLLKLTDDIGKLVDEGEIKLSNAYALAKLEPEEQADFVDRAMAMPPQQFTPTVNARIKELRDAKRKGREAGPVEFQPVPLLRGRAEILAELEGHALMPSLLNEVTGEDNCFKRALEWVLNLDPASAELQKTKDEERKEEKKRQTEKSKLERTRKRAKEAAEKSAELNREAEELATN